MDKNLFERVPEFLAAFKNVLDNGFFEMVDLKVDGQYLEGEVNFCRLHIIGCIPVRNTDRATGVAVLIDPNNLIAYCEELGRNNKVGFVRVEIKNEIWPILDDNDCTVGIKGVRITMSMTITFNT